MECLGPECAEMLLEWLRARSGEAEKQLQPPTAPETPRQGLLWNAAPYSEEAPAHRLNRGAGRRARASALRRLPAV